MHAVKSENKGILSCLELSGIGPVLDLSMSFTQRLNLITGDNGLGKSFLLECLWWALSGEWASYPAYPRKGANKEGVKIACEYFGEKENKIIGQYDWSRQAWKNHRENPVESLAIYARVDQSFAIWDPVKAKIQLAKGEEKPLSPLKLTKEKIWDGEREYNRETKRERTLCNGLLSDWVGWQYTKSEPPFETFEKLLLHLSPDSLHS